MKNLELERPLQKIVQHLEDALMHLYNVKTLSHDEIAVLGSSIAHARQLVSKLEVVS